MRQTLFKSSILTPICGSSGLGCAQGVKFAQRDFARLERRHFGGYIEGFYTTGHASTGFSTPLRKIFFYSAILFQILPMARNDHAVWSKKASELSSVGGTTTGAGKQNDTCQETGGSSQCKDKNRQKDGGAISSFNAFLSQGLMIILTSTGDGYLKTYSKYERDPGEVLLVTIVTTPLEILTTLMPHSTKTIYSNNRLIY
ncbi:hypothetical protein BEWA_001570 [Theileria equi strain WA]|uniref:Uncharacterized protein n=1 Tax=Theileria equi strain WA TaxID=1537102 RepID=L0AYV5_THEEQ|nr:hypothetical protein BEWA_001570 [Theileria equi strain WA]AFZ80750.1 hypothetical protein BEWA_001570 [Theileria equi strain WA]|eukprot:XP_004830416.1 hypothetical protein BEWA_001570 [Theileria equi strain WA]